MIPQRCAMNAHLWGWKYTEWGGSQVRGTWLRLLRAFWMTMHLIFKGCTSLTKGWSLTKGLVSQASLTKGCSSPASRVPLLTKKGYCHSCPTHYPFDKKGCCTCVQSPFDKKGCCTCVQSAFDKKGYCICFCSPLFICFQSGTTTSEQNQINKPHEQYYYQWTKPPKQASRTIFHLCLLVVMIFTGLCW